MYVKLALSNARRAIKDYIIYFVTLIICVSLFYAFTSLSSSHYELITEDTYNFQFLKLMLKYTTYIITALLILLIGYVNKYMIKRRKREFATYILLGIPQRNVAFMFFIETLVMGIISIAIGIFLGTLLSQLVTALIFVTINQAIIFSFRFYMDTVLITVLFFVVMFCIIGLMNVRALNKAKLIQMMNDEKKTELQFRWSKTVYISIFILAILLYVLCGYSIHKILVILKDPKLLESSVLTYFKLAIGGFIAGTYALFYSLAYILIVAKERWISFKYEYTNLFLIGAVVSKIKTAPILIATISLTFLGAALSFTLTLILSQWSLGYLNNRIPFDTIVVNKLNNMSKVEDISKIDYKELVNNLGGEGYDFKNYCEVEQYYIFDKELYDVDMRDRPLFAIGLGDYNQLRKMLGLSEIKLNSNEFTTQWLKLVDNKLINEYLGDTQTLKIKDRELRLSSNTYYKDSIGEYIYNTYRGGLVIIPDELCKSLTLATKDFYANTSSKISYEELVRLENEHIPDWYMKSYGNMLSEKYRDKPLIIRLKAAERNEILNVTLGMRILGIYGGVVLLMISLTVLALQQLVDSIEHRGRFNTLRKLGIDNKETSGIILKQISLYFAMPIIIAAFGFIIFFNAFKSANKELIDIYIGDKAFVFNIGLSLLLIVVIYSCYFATTYYSFKRNIDSR